VKTFRPPNLSVQMPSGILTAAAKNGSIAAKISTWVTVKSYHLIRKGASAANIPQTAKPSVNARDDIHRTLVLPDGSAAVWSTGSLASTTGILTVAPYKKVLIAGCILIAGSLRLRQQTSSASSVRLPRVGKTAPARQHTYRFPSYATLGHASRNI
jgi:hypothetical protein